MAGADIEGETISAFYQECGLFTHDLETWKREFTKPDTTQSPVCSNQTLKPLQANLRLENRGLQRKENALTKTTALMAL